MKTIGKKGIFDRPGGKNLKKNGFFLRNDWNFLKVHAILLALCAQICFVVEGVDVRRKMPKPAWQLEKELKALRQESEKKTCGVDQ